MGNNDNGNNLNMQNNLNDVCYMVENDKKTDLYEQTYENMGIWKHNGKAHE
jgi:hypothetical protein